MANTRDDESNAFEDLFSSSSEPAEHRPDSRSIETDAGLHNHDVSSETRDKVRDAQQNAYGAVPSREADAASAMSDAPGAAAAEQSDGLEIVLADGTVIELPAELAPATGRSAEGDDEAALFALLADASLLAPLPVEIDGEPGVVVGFDPDSGAIAFRAAEDVIDQVAEIALITPAPDLGAGFSVAREEGRDLGLADEDANGAEDPREAAVSIANAEREADAAPARDPGAFSGDLASYAITFDGATGVFTVTANNPAAGDDAVRTVSGVETFTFNGVAIDAAALQAIADQTLTGMAADETLTGGTGDDVIDAMGGNDAIDGGAGDDVAVFSGNAADYAVAYDGPSDTFTLTGPDGTDAVTGVETFRFADGDVDAATLQAGADQTLTGGAVGETLTGGTGDDVLNAMGGNDAIDGGAGDDVAVFSGNAADYSVAYDGPSDTFTLTGPDGTDAVTGVETFRFADGDVDAATLQAGADQTLTGTDGNETLAGGSGDDEIYGVRGHDTLIGGDGDDRLEGESGGDVFDGGDGSDSIHIDDTTSGVDHVINDTGASGVDTLFLDDGGGVYDVQSDFSAATSGIEIIDGSAQSGERIGSNAASVSFDFTGITLTGVDGVRGTSGDDSIIGSSGADVLTGLDGADALTGGDGGDTLDGGAGNDALDGGGGADDIDGGAGDDILHGDAGTDAIVGGGGNDIISGGAGADDLSGDAGSDVFLLIGAQGSDQIDGGAAGGWTDSIEIQALDDSPISGAVGDTVFEAADWTVTLSTGEITVIDAESLSFTEDAAGSITFDNGDVVSFENIETVTWDS